MYTVLVNKVKIFEAKLFVLKIRDLPIMALLFTWNHTRIRKSLIALSFAAHGLLYGDIFF